MAKKEEATIEERIIEIVQDQLAPDNPFTKDLELVKDCGADSLDLVEIIIAVEDEFGMEISDEDAEQMVTVKDIISYVGKQLKQ